MAARCLQPRIQAFAADQIQVDPHTPFDLLGLDSLATIELAAALEAELGRELPADILAGCTDVRTLAARLARHGIDARRNDDPFEQMFADAVLADDVRPARSGATTDLRAARNILLTGATGFLGHALLAELLNTTSASIVCLVRPKSGRQKLAVTDHSQRDRVQWIEGDLTHPRLGLSESRYEALATEVDSIVHCGAAVNWVFSYGGLRASNVLGTLELLRLACRGSAAFHFISSLSVCYSTEGPRTVNESFDPLSTLRGVHLGYAQTKIVAEALVRQAGDRGLPVRIYRPALISGHSRSGAFNRDDLISALVRGCVAMGTAPDLDWNLDCEPVDSVAAAIVQLSSARGPVFHFGHERPRHWRECVLWMRTYGYDLRLVSYPQWLRQLERATRPDSTEGASHPLRPLRSFFLERPAGGRGLTLPELYEERRRTQADSTATRAQLRKAGHTRVPLDAGLLATYFGAFRSAGDLPNPPCVATTSRASGDPLALDTKFLSDLLGTRVSQVDILSTGSEHSIVSELTAWRSSRRSGLFKVRVTDTAGANRDLMVKVKARDTDVIAIAEDLAHLVDPVIGREYSRFADRIGLAGSHVREIEIYRQQDPRFRRHSPALLGSVSDAEMWVAALEHIDDAVIFDTGSESPWRPAQIERAIDGLSVLHAIWIDREVQLREQPWLGHVHSTQTMTGMSDLWGALAAHAAPAFSSWADPDIAAIHRRLVSQVDRWWPALESSPRTLIHNDFNPRNICLRGPDATLCAFDWELATLGAPGRDLAELLCFTGAGDITLDEVKRSIERHRSALERECGRSIDREPWLEGFRSGLYDLLINRLSIYAVVHRVRPQRFLPRVVRTWRHLYQLFPLERAA